MGDEGNPLQTQMPSKCIDTPLWVSALIGIFCLAAFVSHNEIFSVPESDGVVAESDNKSMDALRLEFGLQLIKSIPTSAACATLWSKPRERAKCLNDMMASGSGIELAS